MISSSISRAFVASTLLLSPLAFAQTGANQHPPTAPERFVEVTGQMEFRGMLIALPLQAKDAVLYGLSQAQLEERQAKAKDALSEYKLERYYDDTDEYLIDVGLGNEQAAAEALMADGNFRYVTPDWIVYPLANCTDDTLLGSQWHHDANIMNSCDGWMLETGSTSVTVAICDTGLRVSHSEFQLHRKEGYNAVDQKWESNGGQINDLHGHGTNTTGCAAANGNNANGVSGVGWDLSHRIMRVSNSSGGGSTITILNHAARTASDAGDRVASISYSGVTSPANQTTGAYVRAQGGLVVWAAGNAGQKLTGSRDDDLIVVVATDSNDNKPGWSNWGGFCDLAAPGVSVFTTTDASNNSYGSVSGTSFSCPLTAGMCAMIFSRNPALTPQEAEDILRAGCDDIGAAGVDTTFGYGRIDLGQTMALIASCGVENYCSAQANSTGATAFMAHSGSASLLDNDLVIAAASCPTGQFGLFFLGDAQISAPSGDGTLCVGGSLARFPVVATDAFGSASQVIDLNNLPFGSGPFFAGDTTNFSFWFRDTTPGGWNFADGLSVVWCD